MKAHNDSLVDENKLFVRADNAGRGGESVAAPFWVDNAMPGRDGIGCPGSADMRRLARGGGVGTRSNIDFTDVADATLAERWRRCLSDDFLDGVPFVSAIVDWRC